MAKKPMLVEVPPMDQANIIIRLTGTNPLMVNNKLGVAWRIADQYDSSKPKPPKPKPLTPEEAYAQAFYVMPSSPYKAPHPKAHYCIPTSGIKKCVNSAIRLTGITDNTTVGLLGRSFWITADEGGMTRIYFDRIEMDRRPVNIGSGQKTVPRIACRPMFHGWYADVLVGYNPLIVGPAQLINLFRHAGQYIGWGEMRAQKNMGECGGFTADISPNNNTKARKKRQ